MNVTRPFRDINLIEQTKLAWFRFFMLNQPADRLAEFGGPSAGTNGGPFRNLFLVSSNVSSRGKLARMVVASLSSSGSKANQTTIKW
ncbi:MAG: hypothetical protein ACTS4V_00545 [Candidatus Hodgkinia cicadicola]